MALLSKIVRRATGAPEIGLPSIGVEVPRRPSLIKPSIPENLITGMVDIQDRRPQRSRVGVDSGYIHVSSLVDICARREVISKRYNEQSFQSINGFHHLMWKMGRVAEKHIRGAIIDSTGGRTVYGCWHCACGSEKHVGMKPDQSVLCPKCESSMGNYSEHPIRNEEYKITGSCDLPLMTQGYFVPVEIKSMNKAQWDTLARPIAEHELQVALYRWLYQQANWRVHDKAIIVYAVKEYRYQSRGVSTPYKEFQVDCESDRMVTMVDMALEQAAIVRDSETNSFLPARVCENINVPRAKRCSMAHLCFGLSE